MTLETGVLVDPLPLWEDELKLPERFSNPALIETIKREGCGYDQARHLVPGVRRPSTSTV